MTTWSTLVKAGAAWLYNQAVFTYNITTDPRNGSVVRYDAVGTATTWTTQPKS